VALELDMRNGNGPSTANKNAEDDEFEGEQHTSQIVE
jgi:hypothetical protein